ncbi:Phenylacetate--CoA ligase [Desulfofarcimen acetoxidans DSM 771]|uniref:Phenylacetate-coenzyme A ligase n=1 Tax=Desulfofarcimen acetoxidans (strain ATCC 49208 / DSM 771 / KCTC 5769 / VKM B-1644 / 5575) TaxID=485916 RepID=C8VVD6_DESAS|nr:phenylacetate--CoA ligase [Desulfofarcimen acetoxidans]ACV61006.1 Phenylacetate--CoA ligase [Desulfofarcimen acetoxidans DSM 771]
MIWDPDVECMDREAMQSLQLQRLQETVRRVFDRIPFYRESFTAAGVKPADIQKLKDIEKLPFTVKNDLRDNYPYGLFAVPLQKIIRLHASSGTTGKPIVVGYTKKDIETWTELVARLVTMAGVTSDDVAQITFGYGLFTGAFGLHYGLERVGATIVPASTGNTEKQVMLMQDFGTTALIGTPSYVLHLAESVAALGIDPSEMKLRVGMFGSEVWSESMRAQIERAWGIKATDNYGLSEVMGPGVSGECSFANGLHIAEDHFLLEIIDPDTGEGLDYGQEGEVVITTLTKEGIPLIRYRTRDISVINTAPCECGRSSARLRKIGGRTDDMLIISGVNVFPSQIESVIMNIEGVAPHYQIVVGKKGYLDYLEVQVEIAQERFTGNFKDLEELEQKIRRRLHNVLSISPRVRLMEPLSIERSVGKAKRIIDNRPK